MAEGDAGKTRVKMTIPRHTLRGVSGETFGKTFQVYGSQLIGRNEDCDIVLPSDAISRQHAQISIDAGVITIKDLGSANGTFVNGKKVDQAKVEDGDEIAFDHLRFLVQAPVGTKPAAAAVSPGKVAEVKQEEKASSSGGFAWVTIIVFLIVLALAWWIMGPKP